jgi:hypothetical protein
MKGSNKMLSAETTSIAHKIEIELFEDMIINKRRAQTEYAASSLLTSVLQSSSSRQALRFSAQFQ